MDDDAKRQAAREHLNADPNYRTLEEFRASPWNSWLGIGDDPPIKGLHATLEWKPHLHCYDFAVKVIGYRREDGAGYILPTDGGRWWATWAHPMLCGGVGWHHHALGTYSSATAAAMAFDSVYELERLAGNVDRCPDARTKEPTP